MKYFERPGETELIPEDDFDPVKIFECGQCFRWNMDENGDYTGVAMGKAARIRQAGDSVFISGTLSDFENVWHDYFDLGKNYSKLRRSLCVDEYMKNATDFGAGIRILNQDRWEALCSFIISQCNNIPRIKKIVETLCSLYGDPIEFEGDIRYTFPSASRVALLEESDLAPLRCGYRAPYIIGAARAVDSGALDLEALSGGTLEEAEKALRSLKGVGKKVANCAILFSLRIEDAFPIDVWMKKAISEHYNGKLDTSVFGGHSGLAQQYMFYYQRSNS
ncbi:MAG: DNA-3-methyladenine glycosylase 2 family protein [Oscillospiraceae bacterium]|nr:DNA-3-methyladenine glycosylase 2 family protein [Oscillospiraceae bacterium]